MIPQHIIFCNEGDNIKIFDKLNPYIIHYKIHYVSNGYLFNPPFYDIIILFETVKTNDDDLKLLWNMTKLNGFLIIPNDINFFKDNHTKEYKNYIQIQKTNNIVYTPSIKWRTFDFAIYGTQKGGTSAARKNLSLHPDLDIYKEEIHFFDKYWFKGIDWFKRHFNYKKKLVGYKNPDIMYIEETHHLINNVNPFVKIILILRNPINRAYSEYRMLQTHWKEKKTFEECINEEKKYRLNEVKNLHNSTYHILQRGLYYKQILNLLKYFPKNNIIILISEKVKQNMEEEYNKIFDFLNVDKLYGMEYTEEFVASYEKEINKNTYDELVDFFKEDVNNLENYLGYNTGWF